MGGTKYLDSQGNDIGITNLIVMFFLFALRCCVLVAIWARPSAKEAQLSPARFGCIRCCKNTFRGLALFCITLAQWAMVVAGVGIFYDGGDYGLMRHCMQMK